MYGREMVAKDSRLGENWIYVVLTRMVACGYLAARQETPEGKQGRGGPKRRLYKATGFGNRMFATRIQSDATAALRFQALNTGALCRLHPRHRGYAVQEPMPLRERVPTGGSTARPVRPLANEIREPMPRNASSSDHALAPASALLISVHDRGINNPSDVRFFLNLLQEGVVLLSSCCWLLCVFDSGKLVLGSSWFHFFGVEYLGC